MNLEQAKIFDDTGCWLINQFKLVMDDITINGYSSEKNKKWDEIENRLIQWQKDFNKIEFDLEEGEEWKNYED